jgi:hypothetical protein
MRAHTEGKDKMGMRKRYVVLGLSSLLALAVAVPAFGGASNPTATTSITAKKLAKKANKKANDALNAANAAQDTADEALAIAQQGGEQGPAGPRGPQGPRGPAGPAGPASGLSGLQRVSDVSANNSVSRKTVSVSCPAGKNVVGTGYDNDGATTGTSPNEIKEILANEVIPNAALTSVSVATYETDPVAGDWTTRVFAICADT